MKLLPSSSERGYFACERSGRSQASQKILSSLLILAVLGLSACSTVSSGLKSTWTEEQYSAFTSSLIEKHTFSFSGDLEKDRLITPNLESLIWDFLKSENLGNPFETPQVFPTELNLNISFPQNESLDIQISNKELAQDLYVWVTKEAANPKLAEQMWRGFQRGTRTAIDQESEMKTDCISEVVTFFGQQALSQQSLETPANLICQNQKIIFDQIFLDLTAVDQLRERDIQEDYISVIIDLSDSTYPLDQLDNVSSIFDDVKNGNYLTSIYSLEKENYKNISIEFIAQNSSLTKKFTFNSKNISQKIDMLLKKENQYFDDNFNAWKEITKERQNLSKNNDLTCNSLIDSSNYVIATTFKDNADLKNELLELICRDYQESIMFIGAVREYVEKPNIESGSDILGAVTNSLKDFQFFKKEIMYENFDIYLASDLRDNAINLNNSDNQKLTDTCSQVISNSRLEPLDSNTKFSVTLIGTGKTVYDSKITEKYIAFWSCVFSSLNADVFQTTTIRK